MKKMTTKNLRELKGKSKISMLTCYDFNSAQALNETELNMILIGDSASNIVMGHDTTVPITIEEMIYLTKIVRRGAPDKFLVFDMPFGSYINLETGLKNATKAFKETGCDAIKLEGANQVELDIINRLTEMGVPVIGHIGLKPQRVKLEGGYFIKGKTEDEVLTLKREVKSLVDSGAFAIVLECVTHDIAKELTKMTEVITIGIGSGRDTDGQVLVLNDLLGDSKQDPPGFCKPKNNFYKQRIDSVNSFIEEIK